ncbi:transposase [Bradyrhizobium elkanii USDA 61]|nr:transposase [Bradyrhizobium elkanii USDA 61]
MIIALRYVGIDISKKHLDIFDEADGVPRRIANATQAITQQVARWQCDALVVFEATGIYDLALREALRQAGIQFARINPARARDFARASGLLAKTDPIDARMLAAFARAMQPAPEQVADPARGALARLAKRRDQLVLMRAQEKNRRSEADDRAMAERIGRLIEVLDSEIAEIEADISALIKAEAQIADDAKLMRSLPGRGSRGLHAAHRADAGTRAGRTETTRSARWPCSLQRRQRHLPRQAQDCGRPKARS